MGRRLIAQLVADEQGQDLIEYALLAAFISIIAVSAITSIGAQVNSWYEGYNTTVHTIPGANGGS
jgi:Flp pilus assembly pilin Flp